MKKIHYLLITFLLTTILANAQLQQVGADIDGDTANDISGIAVSINSDGSIIAIGAIGNAGIYDGGSQSGNVRIFELQSGNWVQIGNSINGEMANDRSGGSISLNNMGNIIAIGAHFNDGNGEDAGHVRIFENISNNWIQIGSDIDGENAGDKCGSSLSLNADGTVVAISSVESDLNGTDTGSVRIFKYQDNNWTQIGSSLLGDSSNDKFGNSICLSSDGSTIAIGCSTNDENGTNSGQVKIFENIDDNWVQIGNNLFGEYANNYFGSSVSLNSDGSILAIGIRGYDGNGDQSGIVRVYQKQLNDWIQIGNDIIGEFEHDSFGTSVSLNDNGSVLIVGAKFNDDSGIDSGHARVYQFLTNDWVQIGQDISGEGEGDFYGYDTQLNSDGTTAIIGGPFNDGNGSNAGHTRVYSIITSNNLTEKSQSCSVYPNPTTQTLNITDNSRIILCIQINDILGQNIKTIENINCNNLKIDCSCFIRGLYTLIIHFDNEIIIEKIILE